MVKLWCQTVKGKGEEYGESERVRVWTRGLGVRILAQ